MNPHKGNQKLYEGSIGIQSDNTGWEKFVDDIDGIKILKNLKKTSNLISQTIENEIVRYTDLLERKSRKRDT